MVFAQGWMTEHHRAVLDQTAASKRSNAVMSVFCLWQLVPITVHGDIQQDNDNKILLNLDMQLIKSHLDFIKKMTEKLFPMWVESVRAVRVVFQGV